MELGEGDAYDRCGSEFGSLRELIVWLIRQHRFPSPPGPDPFINQLTEVAEGLQKIVIAASVSDARVRASLAADAVKVTQTALKGVENSLQQKHAA
ncbi:MAG TPA: hypothetical protein VFU86_16575 [Terriglobales bacterium]|nr:hypothetical protein [Terriglobales bacterium]